jgi:DNA-directed RNA polymerase specialized sigma24 family protein
VRQAILEVTVYDGQETARPTATDPEHNLLEQTLYDAHAARLYAYCWSLVGDDAPEALKDTFAAAGRLGDPRGDTLLWLYALARTACLRRGGHDPAFGRAHDPDPLRRAAGRLRASHREALVLSAGDWLDAPDIARLLGVAIDTVRQLIQTAGAQLERAVLDALMHEPMSARHDDVIAAFEKGRLPELLARRAPAQPPALLRAEILPYAGPPVTPARPLPDTTPGTAPLPATSPQMPLVVIGAQRTATTAHSAGRRSRRIARTAGLAAAAAAAAGLFAAWPSTGGEPNGLTAAAPTPTGYSASLTSTPDHLGSDPANSVAAPFSHVPGITPPARPAWPDGAGGAPEPTSPSGDARPTGRDGTQKPDTVRPPVVTPPVTATSTPTPTPTDQPTEPPETPSETPQPTPTPSSDPTTPVPEESERPPGN